MASTGSASAVGAGPAIDAVAVDVSRPEHSGPAPTVLRAGLSIVAALLIICVLAYANSSALEHVIWSGTGASIIFYVGATVAAVMVAFMLQTYRSARSNLAMAAAAALVFAGSFWLLQSRSTVRHPSDTSGVSSFHSILTPAGEQTGIEDVPAHDLGDDITVAHNERIMQLIWLPGHVDVDESATATQQTLGRPGPGSVTDS